MLKNKKSANNSSNASNEAIYRQTEVNKETQPEFKPGDMPHLNYGNEVLNANQDWSQLITDIRDMGYPIKKIARYLRVKQAIVKETQKLNYSHLTFRLGAKLSALHARCYPKENGALS